jgi:CRP/FNR family cyclic AMP-dependent transcriptional regulator
MSSVDTSSNGSRQWRDGCLLASVPEPDRLEILQLGHPKRYDRGEILIRADDAGQEAFLIIDGCTKIIGDSADGNPSLLAIRMAGDMVGEFSALDGHPRSASVQAAAPTRVRVISGADLGGFLATHPATLAALQSHLTAKLREAIRDRIELNGAPVLLRLARVICKLGGTYGTQTAEGLLISVPLSQADFGSLVGTTEQSIRRALSILRNEDLVRTQYRTIIITDMSRLQRVANGRVKVGNGQVAR